MKSIVRLPFLFILLTLMLLALSGCNAYLPAVNSGGLVVGQSYHLAGGDTLNEDLTVIGGDARLDEGSTVNGDVAVIGGSVIIDGQINGSVSILGGSTTLKDNARVSGDVDVVGGTVHKSEKAVIEGSQTSGGNKPSVPVVPVIPPTIMRTPPLNVSFDPIGAPLMAIFQGLAMAALAVLMTLFAPIQLDRAGQAAISQPAASGGVGCLTLMILVIMSITIILLPIGLLGFMVVMVAALFGWAALGLIVGRQIAVWTKQPWTDPVNAGVGTLVISLLASLLNVLWCVGGPIYIVVGLVVLGATVLTRFGTQSYPNGYYSPSARPAAPYIPPTAPIRQEEPPQPYTGGAQVYDERPDTPPAETNDNPPA